jgi:hypothetical protein
MTRREEPLRSGRLVFEVEAASVKLHSVCLLPAVVGAVYSVKSRASADTSLQA